MIENTMIDRIDEYKSRRKKRKLRRIAFALLFTGFAVLLSWFFESQVTTTVIITTHAELETDLNANSGLSDQGIKRANSLASTLSSVDVVSGVDAIYATTYRATQETAEPISRLLDLPINIVDQDIVEDFIESIKNDHSGQIILIVSHPENLSRLVVELQGSKNINIESLNKNNQLFIVTVPWFGKVKTLQLTYGA
ncbi:MAG: phosphoglycerate mutase family protein [Pseudomonadota bacterium]|nr:phosphoglycerate mutase family protein [Pseudomonadota bacterium]